jgi:HEAT repeat protein
MALRFRLVRPVLLALLLLPALPAAGQVKATDTRASEASQRVNLLVERFWSDDPTVRGAAAMELRRTSDPAALPVLLDLVPRTADGSSVRAAVIDALANFKDQRKIPALLSLIVAASNHSDAAKAQLARLGGAARDAVFRLADGCTERGIDIAAQLLPRIEPDPERAILAAAAHKSPCRRQAAMAALVSIPEDVAVPALKRGTRDRVADVRKAAEEGLATIEDPFGQAGAYDVPDTVSGELLEQLRSPDPSLRAAALAEIGQQMITAATPVIAARLKDADVDVRVAAAMALEETNRRSSHHRDERERDTDGSRGPLVAALEDPEPEVRAAAAHALGEIENWWWGSGSAGAKVTFDALVLRLGDTEVVVRLAAIEALGELRNPAGVPRLAAELSHPDAAVRRKAADSIGYLGQPDGIDPLVPLLRDPDRGVRIGAATALNTLVTEGADRRVVTPLLEALRDPELRSLVIGPLGRLKDPRAVGPLLEFIVDEERGTSVCQVCWALSQIGDRAAVQPLLPYLKRSSETVRLSVAGTLADLADPSATADFLVLLENGNPLMRQIAARGLGRFGRTEAVEPLIRHLTDDDEKTRRAAAESLGLLGDRRAVTPLAAVLDVTLPEAADALGGLGDPATVPVLVAALRRPGLNRRERAARALGRLRDVSALDALIAALDDQGGWDRLMVQQEAATALGEIGGPRALAALQDRLSRFTPPYDWSAPRQALIDAIRKLGATPVEPRRRD